MSPEKMTAEDVASTLDRLRTASGLPRNVDALRAHLAALEAERDEERAALKVLADVAELHGWDGVNNSKVLAVFLDRELKELATVRERVRVLEADLRKTREVLGETQLARMAAESRLSGILQRAGDAEGLARAVVLAEGRLRPEDWIYVDAAHRAAPAALGAAVARYVVGEDGAGAPVDGAWEGPEHPEQEDARADVSAAPTVAEDGAGAHDALVPPSGAVLDVTPGFRLDPAPATDEAFATAREEVDALTSSLNMPETFRKVAGLLSLLERRMGAMARAVRLVREEMADEQEPTRVSTETARALAEALTDAPAVYTVEEVIGAAAVALVDYEATRDIPGASFERGLRVRLAALRR